MNPNDEANLGQSSNDIFPTATHLAAALGIRRNLLPALAHLQATLDAKATAFAAIVKIGRTHLQDATPLTLGQEFSGYVAQLDHARTVIDQALAGIRAPLGSRRNQHSGKRAGQFDDARQGQSDPVRSAHDAVLSGAGQRRGHRLRGGASGNFELNAYKPLIAHNLLQSIRLLADGMRSFEAYCVRGIEAQHARIAAHLERSLMLVTALVPRIGHDRTAEIARKAQHEGGTLRDAAMALG